MVCETKYYDILEVRISMCMYSCEFYYYKISTIKKILFKKVILCQESVILLLN